MIAYVLMIMSRPGLFAQAFDNLVSQELGMSHSRTRICSYIATFRVLASSSSLVSASQIKDAIAQMQSERWATFIA